MTLALLQALQLGCAVRRHVQFQSGAETCAELANHGTHFTIDVKVGTPAQKFSVVADTGSNCLIIPSCICNHHGHCRKEDRCYIGTNKSSTFHMTLEEQKSSMVVSFGSGDIQGVVAHDSVEVGHVLSSMDDGGLLLMVDSALNIAGPFEGILGLGIPQAKQVAEQDTSTTPAAKSIQDVIQQIMGGEAAEVQVDEGSTHPNGAGGSHMPAHDTMRRMAPGSGAAPPDEAVDRLLSNATRAHPQQTPSMPKGFLEQANVSSFSICFNKGSNGQLRLNTQMPPNAHGGFGKEHWGLGFHGVSVGNNTEPAQALFCKPGNMSERQQTPCGAIPDSGTTLLMGPEHHINKLMAGICDSWERCSNNYTALKSGVRKASEELQRVYGHNPFDLEGSVSKQDVFEMLLMDCASWMDGEHGLAELPSLHFHVVGSEGTTQTLTLQPHLYVMEMKRGLINQVQLPRRSSAIPVGTKGPHQASEKACMPALGAMDYKTKANGDVWILGTSLFYKYIVSFDQGAHPPSIAFKESPCGTCSLKEDAAARAGRSTMSGRPIQVEAPPRMPRIDTSKPL